MVALPLDASLLISRAMQDEVRGQTIASLIMLPRSVPAIIYSKLAGALLGLAPGLACTISALVASGLIPEFLLRSNAGSSVEALYFVPTIVLLPHLTAVIALISRSGATLLALAAMYAISIVESVLMFAMAVMNLALCAACHFEVLRRFRALAEK
jgi:hypothetical protein